jgi:hypothetical protein
MEPSLPTVKRLFALSQNRCPFPNCGISLVEDSGTIMGVVCHIKARSRGGPRYDPQQTEEERHSFSNLILLCVRHSKLIDSEPNRYTAQWLSEIKQRNRPREFIELSRSDASKAELLFNNYHRIQIAASGPVTVSSPCTVQASNIVIRNQKKRIKILPPSDSLASDLSRRNYVKHLIDRYQEFAKSQPGRQFRYPALYAKIKKRYGVTWEFVPLHQFDDLVSFLQQHVDRTMLGSMNRGKGIPNYSTFSEYRQKYEGQSELSPIGH